MEYSNIKKYNDGTNDILSFELKGDEKLGLDKSIVNGVRRTLISSINSVSFDNITILENNTSVHNEYIKQRIELIPIKLDPDKYKNDYLFMIDVVNDRDDTVVKITTNDFKIYPIKKSSVYKDTVTIDDYDLNSPLSDNIKNIIFKPFKIKDIISYIFITELKSTNSNDRQSLKLYSIPNVDNGYKHAKYNNISNAIYTFHIDDKLFKENLSNQIKLKNIKKEDIEQFSKDYEFEFIERFYHRDINTEPYWYDINISSFHYYSPVILYNKSINIIIQKLQDCIKQFELLLSSPDLSTFTLYKKNKTFVIKMMDYDDTIGNIIQSYACKIDKNNFIQVCGYKKPHPLEYYIELSLFPKQSYSNERQTFNMLVQSINDVIINIINILQEMLSKSQTI